MKIKSQVARSKDALNNKKGISIALALALSGLVAVTANSAWQRHHKIVSEKSRIDGLNGLQASVPGYGFGAGKAAPEKSEMFGDSDPIHPIFASYNAGRYQDVRIAAYRVIDQEKQESLKGVVNPAHKKQAVEARWAIAYSDARQKNLLSARDQFALLQKEAARLPDKGLMPSAPGTAPATLESEAAYEHAVCTAAMGDKPGAEAEYMAFMRRYPDSPYTAAAVKRIGRMHGGNVPAAAEQAWKAAMKTAVAHERSDVRAHSLCGPECLAELIRRKGRSVDIQQLAREMHTSNLGTSLESLSASAKKHGFTPRGMCLTQRGLGNQKLPVIALLTTSHYVIVEHAGPAEVLYWDPDANGTGSGAPIRTPVDQFEQIWGGAALTL